MVSSFPEVKNNRRSWRITPRPEDKQDGQAGVYARLIRPTFNTPYGLQHSKTGHVALSVGFTLDQFGLCGMSVP